MQKCEFTFMLKISLIYHIIYFKNKNIWFLEQLKNIFKNSKCISDKYSQ